MPFRRRPWAFSSCAVVPQRLSGSTNHETPAKLQKNQRIRPKQPYELAGASGIHGFRRQHVAWGSVLVEGRGKTCGMLRKYLTEQTVALHKPRCANGFSAMRDGAAELDASCSYFDNMSGFKRWPRPLIEHLLHESAAHRGIWNNSALGEKVSTSPAASPQPFLIQAQDVRVRSERASLAHFRENVHAR